MNQSIPFFKLFSDYHPIDTIAAAFSGAQVLQLDIDVVRRGISAKVHSPAYIPGGSTIRLSGSFVIYTE